MPLSGSKAVPGELIVSLAPYVKRAEIETILSGAGMSYKAALGRGRHLVALERGTDAQVARRKLERTPSVLYAEPDFVYEASGVPSDPQFGLLWGLDNTGQTVGGSAGTVDADIDAPEAWAVTVGEPTVTVAVVDSGVAYDHPDLAGQIWMNPGETGGGKETNGRDDDGNGYVDDWRGWDWIDDDGDPRDLNGHGTHVAGTIGAQGDNGIGVTGVAQRVSIVPLRALDADGAGRTSDIAAAFDYAGRAGIDVVNASLGGARFSQTLLDSIGRWPNTLFVVAAGNSSSDVDVSPTYPCAYPSGNLICVAATTPRDTLASFSNFGANSVDIGAPGYLIGSAVPELVVPFSEGFESPFEDRWSSQGSWQRSQDEHGFYLSDGLAEVTAGLDMSIEQIGSVALDGMAGCRVTYSAAVDLQGRDDRFIVEGSKDGGAWTTLDAWTGSTQGGWVSLSTDLSTVEGGSARLKIRLVTGPSARGTGLDLDDLRVVCASTRYDDSSYAYMSGTSMAAPHVSGGAALMLSADPSIDPLAMIELLTDTSDPVSTLAGKTVSGGRLNLATALGVPASVEEIVNDPLVDPEPQVPVPPSTVSESPSPMPAASPSPSEPAEAPAEDPSPSPSPQTEEDPQAGEDPQDAQPTDHGRSVTLRFKRHLVALGRVTVTSGFSVCMQDVPIKVRRSGNTVAEARTNDEGKFRLRLPDRAGRYRVIVPEISHDSGSQRCLMASASRRHLH